MEYLLPPYMAFIRTETGKIVNTKQIEKTEIHNGYLYVIWEEIFYETIATFRERVVATADRMEELGYGEKKKPIFRRF